MIKIGKLFMNVKKTPKMKKLLLLLLLPLFTFAQDGDLWRIEFDTEGGKLPIHLLIDQENVTSYFVDADKKMAFDRTNWNKESLHMVMDLYDLEFVLKIDGDTGTGYMNKRGTDLLYRQAPFTASKNNSTRFDGGNGKVQLAGRYEMTFRTVGTERDRPVVGVFEVGKNNTVTGSLLTRSGDYSHLQGNIIGDSLYLSAIITSPILYKAKIEGDSLVGGEQFSVFDKGSDFYAVANDDFDLDDATKRTYLNEGYDRFDFTFKNVFDEEISLSDARFAGKITIVQILGTWCPNCLDETKFLMDYRAKHPDLEVIGLAFERSEDPDYAFPKIMKFVERFGVDYPVLLAGSTQNANEKLPQLNHIMAFPTSIVVDKNGEVRKIHTGFAGPGTGAVYDEYVVEFNEFIENLRNEDSE